MQKFLTDKQTLDDLNIFESSSSTRSIFSCYDFTSTIEGRNKLKLIFNNPVTDIEEISYRSNTVRQFLKGNINLSFDKESIDFIEFYLRQNSAPKRFSVITATENSLKNTLNPGHEYYVKRRGVTEVLSLVVYLHSNLSQIKGEYLEGVIEKARSCIHEIVSNETISKHLDRRDSKIRAFHVERYDYVFKILMAKSIRQLLDAVYEIDMFCSVARASSKYKLCFPTFRHSKSCSLELEGVFHLFLDDPIQNDFEMDCRKNVCVLTGVNMSGKSTLIKSIAVALYLAHLGFPVPALKMTISVFNGLLTTINLTDDLANGTSHFFNEVKRVKQVSEVIGHTNNMLVIFDELFRGTNVKDAYDSSLAVIEKFTQINDCFFIISTHIVETATQLESENEKVDFQKLEMTMVNGAPVTTIRFLKASQTTEWAFGS